MRKPKQVLLILSLLVAADVFATGDDKKKTEGVLFQGYAGGMWAPFGVMFGKTYSKGHGLYLTGKLNHHILKTSRYYFVDDHINNTSLRWTYDGEKVYSRWEVNAGGIFKILDNKKGIVLRAYAGAGIERPRYLYSFKKAQSKTVDHTWVEYKEISGYFLNTECGLTFNPNKKWYVALGASSLTKKRELMMTFGIGRGL